MNNPPFCAASRYRPMFTLTDVLPVPNTSMRHRPRPEIVVALHARRSRVRHRVGKEADGSDLLLGEVAPRVVVSQRPLQRDPSMCPLLLRIEGITANRLPDVKAVDVERI